jgi:hypothetical protein
MVFHSQCDIHMLCEINMLGTYDLEFHIPTAATFLLSITDKPVTIYQPTV